MKTCIHFLLTFVLIWSVFAPQIDDAQAQVFTNGGSTTQPSGGNVGAGGGTGSLNIPTNRNTLLPFDPTKYPGVKFDTVRGTGAAGIVATIRGLFGTFKQILAPFLVIMIIWFSIQFIVARGEEEDFNKVSRHFTYLLLGVGIVILADFLSQTFTLYGDSQKTFLTDQGQIEATLQSFNQQIDILIRFVRYVIGGAALFYIIKSGAQILYNPEEETVQKQKEVFIYGFSGLLLIMISESLVRVVFDIEIQGGAAFGDLFTTTSVDVEGGLSLIGNVTNLFLALMSGLFLFTLVVGGALYAFSAGNEERGQKATKIIIGSLMGLVIAFSSYTLVSEFSSGGRQLRETQPTDRDLTLPRTNPSAVPTQPPPP